MGSKPTPSPREKKRGPRGPLFYSPGAGCVDEPTWVRTEARGARRQTAERSDAARRVRLRSNRINPTPSARYEKGPLAGPFAYLMDAGVWTNPRGFEPRPTESGETTRRQRSCRATPLRGEPHAVRQIIPLGTPINTKAHLRVGFGVYRPRIFEAFPRFEPSETKFRDRRRSIATPPEG